MGQLVDGKWQTQPVKAPKSGAFVRKAPAFRNWITPDGAAGSSGTDGFAAESRRYHLYVSYACPWAHRTLIFRKLKSLEGHISVSAAHPDMLEQGWSFLTDDKGATGDALYESAFAHDLYVRADSTYTGRVTVPILWDKTRHTIVSNESSEIIRMFNSAFDGITGNDLDFWPAAQRDDIEDVNARIYDTFNNGVYKCGFAGSQAAYNDAIGPLFDTLDWLEDRLTGQRFLMGGEQTEADWRLFTTLVRFDAVYNVHFKCSRKRIIDYPNLWAFTRDLYQTHGVAETINMDHITRHYYRSHESINPRRIVPDVAKPGFHLPHNRASL